MNLFIGNLNPETTGQSLKILFSEFGEVVSSKIIIDHATGQSKGFGFVEMGDKLQGHNAMDNLDATFFEGNIISVREAKQNTTGGGSGGGGGFNRNNNNRSFSKPRTPRPGGYNSGGSNSYGNSGSSGGYNRYNNSNSSYNNSNNNSYNNSNSNNNNQQ